MSDQVLVALVSTIGASLVAITALLLNYRGFGSIERRLERLEQDMKEFYKMLGTTIQS